MHEFLRELRARWYVVCIGSFLGIAAGWLISVATTEVFEARARLYVSASAEASDLNSALQGAILSQQRVKSYAQLIEGREIAARTSMRLTNVSTDEIDSSIRTVTLPETVLIDVIASSGDPGRAAEIANAVGATFSEAVVDIEARPQGSAAGAVQVRVAERAVAPAEPVYPRTGFNLVVGLALGLGLAVTGLRARMAMDRTIRDGQVLATHA